MVVRAVKTHGWVVPTENFKKVSLPGKRQGQKKLLVLDMDETMTHWVQEERKDGYDVKVTMDYEEGGVRKIKVPINIRPWLPQFLLGAEKKFQIVVFTASQQSYADPILDYVE